MDVMKLKIEMVKRNVTQAEIGEACGLTNQTVSNYMRGHGSFTTDQAVKICQFLGIDDMEQRAEIFLP